VKAVNCVCVFALTITHSSSHHLARNAYPCLALLKGKRETFGLIVMMNAEQ